jgi:hypothetical protein
MRVVLEGKKAELFIDDAAQPALIIDRSQVAADADGNVGLWIGLGTRAEFKDLRITPRR